MGGSSDIFKHNYSTWIKTGLTCTGLGSLRCKHSVRWQHISQMKDVLCSLIKNILSNENAAGYHPRPVAPSTTDEAPFARIFNEVVTLKLGLPILS